jgi:hypothetical protein
MNGHRGNASIECLGPKAPLSDFLDLPSCNVLRDKSRQLLGSRKPFNCGTFLDVGKTV